VITKLLKRFQSYRKIEIRVGKVRMEAILADTPVKRMIGLMHRSSLGSTEGMLLAFNDEIKAQIWMRNMLFPIDVIWLDKRKRIVDIKEKLQPSGDLRTYSPKADAKYVLELNSGFVKKNRIRGDSRVSFYLK
jgi:hypothetical protein